MKAVLDLFGWEVLHFETLQQGLINKTYSVFTPNGTYILQTINHQVFKEPQKIDANINLLGQYLKQTHPDYLFTELIPALSGETLIEWEGQFFRAFKKIDAYALSVLENANQVKEAAIQFGKFTHLLSEFPVEKLQITLPDFHNLTLRYHQFKEALSKGDTQRIHESRDSILFLKSFDLLIKQFEKFIHHKDVKKRVTHHDTKISNVLFQKIYQGEKSICVIDLDTVMPGYYISDIGDMCRTCLCPVSEEETNLNSVKIDRERWVALQNGYLTYMKNDLSSIELDHFFYSGQFMIYMQALRFLTDHLNMDQYYGSKYEGQNLKRAQNQIRLLEEYNKLI